MGALPVTRLSNSYSGTGSTMQAPIAQNPIVAAASYPPIAWDVAKHYGGVRLQTRHVVIHCTDGSESLRAAENCADMFHTGAADASAHEAIDGNSIVRCVPLDHIAYHCGHTGNSCALGIEICGLASQTREQWLDSLSLPGLQIAARRIAELCKQFCVPPVYSDYTAVKRCTPGITTHLDVTRAWGQSTHRDPGPGFPLADFIEAVRVCIPTLP